MAKSDSFFIRAILTVDPAGGTFVQNTIPLGSYVDALGQAVLRVHNVEYEWVNSDGSSPTMLNDAATFANAQITTQSQTAITTLFDKSVVFKSQLWARNPDSAIHEPSQVYNDSHAPQHFSNGYLVAVETLYLGGQCGVEWQGTTMSVAVVMECTVEKMSQSAAMALALSQQ